MDTNSIYSTVLQLLGNGDIFLVIGTIVCCLLTAIIKRLINKTATDLTHGFDLCVVAPFLFGVAICGIEAFCTGQKGFVSVGNVMQDGLCMGALSTVFYRLWQSLDKGNIKQLLKDDLFSLFYNQLMAFTDIKEQLINGELSIKEVIGEVNTLTARARTIGRDEDMQEKQEKLATLMKGIFDDEVIVTLVPQMTLALEKYLNKTAK